MIDMAIRAKPEAAYDYALLFSAPTADPSNRDTWTAGTQEGSFGCAADGGVSRPPIRAERRLRVLVAPRLGHAL